MNTEVRQNVTLGAFRPKLAFYHPNARGTGCALQLELHPAHDRVDGSIMLSAANQMTIGDLRGPTPIYPRFDWEGKVTVKLDFNDLSKMLQVFRGECEAIDDGRGLYHSSAPFVTRIVLRHLIEPTNGYSLELYRSVSGGGEGSDVRTHFIFSPWEALGLAEAIAGSMSVISFGIPMLVAHDTSAYVAATKGVRDESAA